MSSNIAKEYIDFSGECIYQYMRLIIGNKVSKANFKQLLAVYNGVKYYNYYPSVSRSFNGNVSHYLKEKIDDLYLNLSPQYKNDLFSFLKQVFCLDNVHEDQIESALLPISSSAKDLENPNETIKELNRLIKENIHKKVNFLNSFKSDVFNLIYTRTSNPKVSLTSLNYEIKFPVLYSETAIRNVYNSGVIDEQRLFIEYNLITVKILKEIINNDFITKYIVDFPYSIFGKKAKKNRLFNIINNDAIKEKLIIKMSYVNYNEHEDQVVEMLQNGFKMAVELDNDIVLTKMNIKKLKIFEYIIIHEEEKAKEFEEIKEKIIIVRK